MESEGLDTLAIYHLGAKHKASESYSALHLFLNSSGQEPWPPFSIMSVTFIS